MSIEVMTWVFKHSPVEVSGHRIVLLVLADHAGDDGGGSYPSIETIAQHARCDRRTAQRALRALEAQGVIEREGTSPKGTVNYRLIMAQGRHSAGGRQIAGGAASDAERGGAHAARTTLNHQNHPLPHTPSPVPGGGISPPQRLQLDWWAEVCGKLAKLVDETVWGLWLHDVDLLGSEGNDVLVVAVQYDRQRWVAERFAGKLATAAEKAGHAARWATPAEVDAIRGIEAVA